jgi:hypothetical protein
VVTEWTLRVALRPLGGCQLETTDEEIADPTRSLAMRTDQTSLLADDVDRVIHLGAEAAICIG